MMSQTDTDASPVVADDSLSMRLTIKSLKLKWPSVQTVTTETLDSWLQGQGHSEPNRTVVLLDARPEEEYAVSHLANAIRTDPDGDDIQLTAEKLRTIQSGAAGPLAVVAYCSVGYRSSKYAHLLGKRMQPSDVSESRGGDQCSNLEIYNLEGSLFKWANEGRPLVDISNSPTVYAHPYSVFWGKLLKAELRKWQ